MYIGNVAKNVILAGVKSVTLYDPTPTKIQDLSSHFFLTLEDVGKPRAEISRPRLAELNTYVPTSVLDGPLNEEKIKKYQVRCVLRGHVCSSFNHANVLKYEFK